MKDLEKEIEDAIRQTLIVINPQGIKYTVKRILKLISPDPDDPNQTKKP